MLGVWVVWLFWVLIGWKNWAILATLLVVFGCRMGNLGGFVGKCRSRVLLATLGNGFG